MEFVLLVLRGLFELEEGAALDDENNTLPCLLVE